MSSWLLSLGVTCVRALAFQSFSLDKCWRSLAFEARMDDPGSRAGLSVTHRLHGARVLAGHMTSHEFLSCASLLDFFRPCPACKKVLSKTGAAVCATCSTPSLEGRWHHASITCRRKDQMLGTTLTIKNDRRTKSCTQNGTAPGYLPPPVCPAPHCEHCEAALRCVRLRWGTDTRGAVVTGRGAVSVVGQKSSRHATVGSSSKVSHQR